MTENELKEMWIGDEVRIIKSGKIGNYAGINKKGRIRIRWKNKILLVDISSLQKYIPDPNIPEEVNKKMEENRLKMYDTSSFRISVSNPNELDLHIEKLAPHLVNEPNYIILNHQIKAFEEFVTYAVSKKRYAILIIHGKGEGVLRNDIRTLAKSDPRIKFSFDKNGGGATEFILS